MIFGAMGLKSQEGLSTPLNKGLNPQQYLRSITIKYCRNEDFREKE